MRDFYITDLMESIIKIVCRELGLSKCRQLCRSLGVTEVEIDTITHDNPGDTETQKYKMLDSWSQKSGPSATVSVLSDKLVDMDCDDVAANLKPFIVPSPGNTLSADTNKCRCRIAVLTFQYSVMCIIFNFIS